MRTISPRFAMIVSLLLALLLMNASAQDIPTPEPTQEVGVTETPTPTESLTPTFTPDIGITISPIDIPTDIIPFETLPAVYTNLALIAPPNHARLFSSSTLLTWGE